MKPKLVIFDCDGVLVDSEPLGNAIIAQSLSEHGLPLDPAQVHALFTGGTMDHVRRVAIDRGAVLPKSWVADIYAQVYAALRLGVAVFDGVHALLDQIEANGIAIAIASNGPICKMEISLGPSGLFNRFSGRIYSGHDFGAKPAPDMLLQACRDAAVTPADAVMIDDSPAGVGAAQAAGVRCYGFAPDGDGAHLTALGAIHVRSMAQIAAQIGVK